MDHESLKRWVSDKQRELRATGHSLSAQCIGGPCDGMLTRAAEAIGVRRGACLFVPAFQVIIGSHGQLVALEHQYAIDHTRAGDLTYVGKFPVEQAAA
jgi:hypothetical protein